MVFRFYRASLEICTRKTNSGSSQESVRATKKTMILQILVMSPITELYPRILLERLFYFMKIASVSYTNTLVHEICWLAF